MYINPWLLKQYAIPVPAFFEWPFLWLQEKNTDTSIFIMLLLKYLLLHICFSLTFVKRAPFRRTCWISTLTQWPTEKLHIGIGINSWSTKEFCNFSYYNTMLIQPTQKASDMFPNIISCHHGLNLFFGLALTSLLFASAFLTTATMLMWIVMNGVLEPSSCDVFSTCSPFIRESGSRGGYSPEENLSPHIRHFKWKARVKQKVHCYGWKLYWYRYSAQM